MSKYTEQLRTIGVFNQSDFYGPTPCIWYRTQDTGRGGHSAAWMVSKRGLNLSTHWSDNGSKAFIIFGRGDRKVKLAEAIDWASEKFSIPDWKRDPFGGYGPAAYVTERIRQLNQRLAQEAAAPSQERSSDEIQGGRVGNLTGFKPGEEIEWHSIAGTFVREVGNGQVLVKASGGTTYQTHARYIRRKGDAAIEQKQLPAPMNGRRTPPPRSANEVRAAIDKAGEDREFVIRSKRWNTVVLRAELIADNVDINLRNGRWGTVTLGVESLERFHKWLGKSLAEAKRAKAARERAMKQKAKAEGK